MSNDHLTRFTSRRDPLMPEAIGLLAVSALSAQTRQSGVTGSATLAYGAGTLPLGVRSRVIHRVNGLDVHVLEAGFEQANRPLALLLHGFPDLAYGWRHVMPLLAEAGYHVVAPDQRGFGRTTGWVNAYDTRLEPFSLLNSIRDALALVAALGHHRTTMLVGHDFGSPVAAYCAIARPDVFPSVVLMSGPFPGTPSFPFDSANEGAEPAATSGNIEPLAAALAGLDPARALYQQYLATPEANADLSHPSQGLHRFLRTFFYVKSADWAGNKPHPLTTPTAEAIAQLPTYYVMERGRTMPENVAPFEPGAAEIAACRWLTEAELTVYTEEYARTGFQGGLQTYRVYTDPTLNAELRLFSGRTIDVPSLFIGGASDWGPYVAPGALDLMQTKATTRLRGIEMIDGAGHWIQQEQPAKLTTLLLAFASEVSGPERVGAS